MKICYVTDGKAGHAAQARGLFAALERQQAQLSLQSSSSLQFLELPVQQCSKLSLIAHVVTGGRLGQLPELLATFGIPDIIVVAGHRTHWTGLLLKLCFPQAKLLVLMKPSLPLAWFDFAIIPAHDSPPYSKRVLVTKGVLNPIVNEHHHQAGRCLILIGGPSKRHGYDQAQLIHQIQKIAADAQYEQVLLTTSRRTPDAFMQDPAFERLAQSVALFPVSQTPQGWLFDQLQQAETVWVTEDSVSMLFEALTAGCKVGILEMPRLKSDRITQSVDQLCSEHVIGSLNYPPVDLTQPFAEADRAAVWLLKKYKEQNK